MSGVLRERSGDGTPRRGYRSPRNSRGRAFAGGPDLLRQTGDDRDDGAGTRRGTNGPDVIVGSDGDDVIYAFGDNDVLCGGEGSDFIDGGTGNDQIFSDARATESGSDVVRGGTGSDFIIDHQARNDLDGGAGDDDVEGIGTVRGGSGNDTVVASGEGTEVFGGSGDDFFLSESAGQLFDGGSGRDQCDTFGPDVFESCEKVFVDEHAARLRAKAGTRSRSRPRPLPAHQPRRSR